MPGRVWTEAQFIETVKACSNRAEAIQRLGLKDSGSSYKTLRDNIARLDLDISHWTGRKRWSYEQLAEAVGSCFSMAGVLRKLGLVAAGGNYAWVRHTVQKLGLDTSHWTGRGHRKGSNTPVRRAATLESLLVERALVSSPGLRIRLIREGVFRNECSNCGLTSWLGGAITLHLDHISGDRTDNRLSNLRLLCPNCHSLTATYCGRNIGKSRRTHTSVGVEVPNTEVKTQTMWAKMSCTPVPPPKLTCPKCSRKYTPKTNTLRKPSRYCSSACSNRVPRQRTEKGSWPSIEVLTRIVWEQPVQHVAKDIGVSGKAVGERCRRLGIPVPPRGYWAKLRAGTL